MLTDPSCVAFMSVAECDWQLLLGLGSDTRSLPDYNVNSKAWQCTFCFKCLLASGLVAHEGTLGCQQG